MSHISAHLKALGYAPLSDKDRRDSKTLLASELECLQLPDDYKQFLIEHPDTGMFSEEVVCAGLEKSAWAPDGLYPVSLLYARSVESAHDLLAVHGASSDWPSHLLVIGDDVGGNYFCLDMRSESFGQVYFYFHESNVGEGLLLLSRSFSSFVDSLRIVQSQ